MSTPNASPTYAPTPWAFRYDDLIAANGCLVAISGPYGQAARIVRAVNNHEDLVAALKAALLRARYAKHGTQAYRETFEQAKSAIDWAEGR